MFLQGDAEEGEMSDLAEDEQKLGEYVAGLAQEASAFAQKYSPSEEEVFEATIACRAMDKVGPPLLSLFSHD